MSGERTSARLLCASPARFQETHRHALAKLSRMRKTAEAERVWALTISDSWRVSDELLHRDSKFSRSSPDRDSVNLPVQRTGSAFRSPLAREIRGSERFGPLLGGSSAPVRLPARTDSEWRPRRPRSGRASPSRGARRTAFRSRDARRASRPARPTTTRLPWTCPRTRSATRRGTR